MTDSDDPFDSQYREHAQTVAELVKEARRRLRELDEQVAALNLQCNFRDFDGQQCPEFISTTLELLESDGMGDGYGPYCVYHLPTVIYATGVGVM